MAKGAPEYLGSCGRGSPHDSVEHEAPEGDLTYRTLQSQGENAIAEELDRRAQTIRRLKEIIRQKDEEIKALQTALAAMKDQAPSLSDQELREKGGFLAGYTDRFFDSEWEKEVVVIGEDLQK